MIMEKRFNILPILFAIFITFTGCQKEAIGDDQGSAMDPDFSYEGGSSSGQILFTSTVNKIKGRSVERYDWDFGDGQQGSASADHPIHYYKSNGTFNVTLSTFLGGSYESVTKQVVVSNVNNAGGGGG